MDIAKFLEGNWIWYLQGSVLVLGFLVMGIRLLQCMRVERAIRKSKNGTSENRFLMGIIRAFQVDNPVKNREKVDNFVDNYLFIHRAGGVSLKNGNFYCGQIVYFSGILTLLFLGLGFYIKVDWNVIGRIFFGGLISTGGLICMERLVNFAKIQEKIRCGLIILLERELWRTESTSNEFDRKRMQAVAGVGKSQADQLVQLSKEANQNENNGEPEETIAERVAREIMQGKAREESMAERIRKENSVPDKESDEKIAAGIEHDIPEETVLGHMDPVEQVAKMTVDLAVEKTARRIRELSKGQETKERYVRETSEEQPVAAGQAATISCEEEAVTPNTACTRQAAPDRTQLSGHDRQLIHDFLCNLTAGAPTSK